MSSVTRGRSQGMKPEAAPLQGPLQAQIGTVLEALYSLMFFMG